MDLTTKYLGLTLRNPLVAAASPLSQKIDNFKKLEDAGIAAIVNHSLFEEQLTFEALESQHFATKGTESFAEALTYFPTATDFVLGPEEYLEHIAKAKKAVKIPVIASLNGHSTGGWVKYAKDIEKAGADALELNIYRIATAPTVTASQVEDQCLEVIKAVKANVKIPLAVKVGPYFSSMANMAKKLDEVGADGLVLFNRFYQPDIDLNALEVEPNLLLSSPAELRLPLRWIAILHGRIKASLAATTGIYTAEDVAKMLLVGADVTMLCATLLKNGIKQASKILTDLERWMEENEYESVKQLQGSMSQKSCRNPEAFERANYMKTLQSYGQ